MLWGDVLCIVGCLIACPVSPHCMPAASHLVAVTTMSPGVATCPLQYNHCSKLSQCWQAGEEKQAFNIDVYEWNKKSSFYPIVRCMQCFVTFYQEPLSRGKDLGMNLDTCFLLANWGVTFVTFYDSFSV